FWPVIEVGPDAAAAILAAYKDNRLPMKKGAAPIDAPLADAYVAKREELLAEVAERVRRARAVKDPSLIVESDLTDHVLIDRIFHAQIGEGNGAMTLAGITVSKTLTRYASNSGKSHGWAVYFSWVGSDGQHRASGTTPP